MDMKAAKDLVRAATGPLLEVLSNETVCVIHHSFTEYLKGIARSVVDGGFPMLRSDVTHERLALVFIGYLQTACLDSIGTDQLEESEDTDLSKIYGRMQYAACFNRGLGPTAED